MVVTYWIYSIDINNAKVEAEEITKNEISVTEIPNKLYVYHKNNEITTENKLSDLKSILFNGDGQSQVLSEISTKGNSGTFVISNPILSKDLHKEVRTKSLLTRTWLISPKNIMTEIKEGDIIKLGRVRLKFDKIFIRSLHNQPTNITTANIIKNESNSVNILSNVAYNSRFQNQRPGSNINFTTNLALGNPNQSGNALAYNSQHGDSNINCLANSITNVNNSINNEHEDSFEGSNRKSQSETSISKYLCRICYSSNSDENDKSLYYAVAIKRNGPNFIVII